MVKGYFTEQEMYDYIKSGMDGVYFLARKSIKKRWNHMYKGARYSAVRALVYMDYVKKNLGEYFPRDKQGQRAAHESNLRRQVFSHTHNAFCGDMDLRATYYRLCDEVRNWEFNRIRYTADGVVDTMYNEKRIIDLTCQIQRMVKHARGNVAVRALKILVR